VQCETDELWLVSNPSPILREALATGAELPSIIATRAVIARHQSNRQRAAAVMLDALFEARIGFGGPTRHLLSGIIDGEAFTNILDKLTGRITARTQQAQAHSQAPIVVAARQAGLRPEPSGTNPTVWVAQCPGTNHFLMIGPQDNTFGCGLPGDGSIAVMQPAARNPSPSAPKSEKKPA
jgi:hypothetical protein